MTNLETFFRFLVAGLAADGRHRLGEPIKVGDLMDLVLPYRANRRVLDIGSLEEYESLVMRLCSGEEELALVKPPTAAQACREMLNDPSPSLDGIPDIREALLLLRPDAVREALSEMASESVSPDLNRSDPGFGRHSPTSTGAVAFNSAESLSSAAPEGARCPACRAVLPGVPGIGYCPTCGVRLSLARCSACRSVVEPGWRHCPFCGQAAAGGAGLA